VTPAAQAEPKGLYSTLVKLLPTGLKVQIRKRLEKFGYYNYQPPTFEGSVDRVVAGAAPHSLNPSWKLAALFFLARSAQEVAGDACEIGVYRGGTGLVLAGAFAGSGRRVLLVDTFTGLPYWSPEQGDIAPPGLFKDVDVEEVRRLFAPHPHCEVIQGEISTMDRTVLDRRYCLVHVDNDQYESHKASFDFFASRLSVGGLFVLDDALPGAKRATEEFLAANPSFRRIRLFGEHVVLIRMGTA
jgi:O-methyltransferase